MKNQETRIARQFLAQARHSLEKHHFARISRCLQMLSEKDIWWRPHAASNSVGNLLLHLEGNVRQWIISGLGGAPDRRDRQEEFRDRGPVPRRALTGRLRRTVHGAGRILRNLTSSDLGRAYRIQGFRVTGFQTIHHVAEHFAYHTGQIIYITKLRTGKDLGFTRLPGEKRKRARPLPAI